MLRVALRGSGVSPVVLGSGETLLVGRAPQAEVPDGDPDEQLRMTALALPECAPHVSRLLGELARRRWFLGLLLLAWLPFLVRVVLVYASVNFPQVALLAQSFWRLAGAADVATWALVSLSWSEFRLVAK